MFSKEKQIIQHSLDENFDDELISNEEHCSLSLTEVFRQLSIPSEGFNPSFFTNQDLANLSVTSKPLRSAVVSELLQRAAQTLLTHVILGKQDEAHAMVEENPQLLLIRTQALDYSGRTIIGTAFQAALGAGDTPMWEMLLPYFEKKEALRQFDEQFPKGMEDTPASELYAYYNAIALAIIQDEDTGLSVVERFRKEITSQKEITHGKHFNLQHLIAASRAHVDNFVALDTPGRNFFFQKVIGYVQRQVTAYDAQFFCSGVTDVLENNYPFRRTFMLSNKIANVGEWFPLLSESGPGFDFAYYIFDSFKARPATFYNCGLNLPDSSVIKYIEGKQRTLAGLRESLSKEFITPSINYSAS